MPWDHQQHLSSSFWTREPAFPFVPDQVGLLAVPAFNKHADCNVVPDFQFWKGMPPHTPTYAATQWSPCIFHHSCIRDEAVLSAADAEVFQVLFHSHGIHVLAATLAGNKSRINSQPQICLWSKGTACLSWAECWSVIPPSKFYKGLAVGFGLLNCRIHSCLPSSTFIFSGSSLSAAVPTNSQCTNLAPSLFSLDLDMNAVVLTFIKQIMIFGVDNLLCLSPINVWSFAFFSL